VPLLGLLQPFAAGLQVGTSAQPAGEAQRLGLVPDWPARLVASRVHSVQAEAVQRLRRAGWLVPAPRMTAGHDGHTGTYVAAALVPRSHQPLRVLRRYLANPTVEKDTELERNLS
jgi:hypothetical protein